MTLQSNPSSLKSADTKLIRHLVPCFVHGFRLINKRIKVEMAFYSDSFNSAFIAVQNIIQSQILPSFACHVNSLFYFW